MEIHQSRLRQSVTAIILSWPDVEARGQAIVNELASSVDEIITLTNSAGNSTKAQNGCVNLGKEAFFTKKFQHCKDVNPDHVLLMIAADSVSTNWAELAKAVRQAFEQHKELGIWAPTNEGTPWKGQRTILPVARISDHLTESTVVDSIVWAISPALRPHIFQLHFGENKYGWGIETLVACQAHRLGFRVVVDQNQVIGHVQGSAYSQRDAEIEELELLKGLKIDLRLLVAAAQRKLRITKRAERTGSTVLIRVEQKFLGAVFEIFRQFGRTRRV